MVVKRTLVLVILSALIFLSSCNTPSNTSPGGTIDCDPVALISAIETANTTKEQVVINLAPDCHYDFIEPFVDNSVATNSALPIINSPIIINGNGSTLRVISTEDPFFRGFEIGNPGKLTINNLYLTIGEGYEGIQLGGLDAGGMIRNLGELTLQNSSISRAFARSGGAISNMGKLLIVGSTISDGYCDGGGGAITNNGGDVRISDSSFYNNHASYQGGAIWSEHINSGDMVIENSIFMNNNTNEYQYYSGGAIFAKGELIITGTVFQSNYSGKSGGAINHGFGYLEIISSSFITNSAEEGGAIYHTGKMDFYADGPGLRIETNDFIMNQSIGHGSAISITLSDPESSIILLNNTISQNYGLSAVYNGGPLHFSYNTVTYNSGIGILTEGRQIPAYLEGVLIANNGQDCQLSFNAVAVESNLDSDGTCSGFSITADPLLEPLANNGGPTLTHALQANSPALHAATGDCPATDQRGEARPGGAACDLGAYEVEDEELAGAEFGDVPEINTPYEPDLDPPLDLNICVARVEELVLCKEGPGDKYPTVSSLKPEGIVEVSGQSLEGDYAVIRNPCYPELRCWVRKTNLVFYCDDGLLPLTSTPPLISPKPDRSGEDEESCDSGATNQTNCENSGGDWVVPLVEAPYCDCN